MKYQIDNANAYEWIKGVKDKSVNLIIIDPPYLLPCSSKESIEKKTFFQRKGGDGVYKNIMSKENFNSGFDYAFLHEEFKRVQPFLNLFIFCNIALLRELVVFYKDYTYTILVWHKPNALPFSSNGFMKDLEYCLFICDDYNYLSSDLAVSSKLFQECSQFYKETKHPTEKPLRWVKNLILKASKKGDVVLDCFSGSGTTAKAAIELDREFIGCEIDKEYYEMSLKRLKRGIEKPLFDEVM